MVPNIGIASLRFPVKDARAFAGQIALRGRPLYAQPMELDIAPYGTITTFAARTPDGAILEFCQSLGVESGATDFGLSAS